MRNLQAQNHLSKNEARSQSNYGSASSHLSPPAASLESDEGGDPISLAFWASAEIRFSDSIALLAEFINGKREMLTRSLYQKIKNPHARFAFGWGFAFADAVAQFSASGRGDWKILASCYDPMPKTLTLPGFFPAHIHYTYGCAQFAMAHALNSQAAPLRKMIEPFSPDIIAEFAQILRLASRIVEQDGSTPPAFNCHWQGPDAFSFQACLACMDQAAAEYLAAAERHCEKNMAMLLQQRYQEIGSAIRILKESDSIHWSGVGRQIKQARSALLDAQAMLLCGRKRVIRKRAAKAIAKATSKPMRRR